MQNTLSTRSMDQIPRYIDNRIIPNPWVHWSSLTNVLEVTVVWYTKTGNADQGRELLLGRSDLVRRAVKDIGHGKGRHNFIYGLTDDDK